MKATSIIVLMLGVCSISLTGAEGPEKQSRWNLAQDVVLTSNEISFSQGSNGVWYFLESASLTHDPFTYSRLPHYTVFCDFDPVAADGSACLGDAERDVVGNRLPAVGVNFSNAALVLFTSVLPPRSVFMHPGIEKLAIVAWKSPVNGKVSVTGSFRDVDPACGDGVSWSIDKGTKTIQSGDLPNGGSASFAFVESVKKDQVLYFTVGPKAEYSCDGTKLALTITRGAED
jgi:hypothetical protein